ncbi:MAG: HPr(Ser) kinase/phosphatase [Opitutales bacterium]|nr:HPr(Ser) kinase/phosphatase [Opitutales bacterium]
MPLRPRPKIVESISVLDFFNAGREQLKMSIVAGERGIKGLVRDKSINRPALALTGYYKSFATKRLQVFGAGEIAYLRDIKEDKQYKVLTEIARRHIPCMIVTRNLIPPQPMVEVANENDTPLIRTTLSTRDFLAASTLLLENMFAPRVSEHGTLMDVKGIGVLIRGDSGVGKSECALALIERGYSLVADDKVNIKLINEKELVGASNDINRGYMECRGMGIINIAELFGIRSVRVEKSINLVITFTAWKESDEEERTGLEQEYFELLGIDVPHIRFSVKPGRDLARLVEVASMVQALKMIGHDSAKEFNERLIQHMTPDFPLGDGI